MQKDHGFNPPPVWTILGRGFAELHGATTGYLQLLAGLDLVYLAGMLGALAWVFGWRVFAVGAIFGGCQSSAPFYWTGGAFLRQDGLFFLVLAACLLRKKWIALCLGQIFIVLLSQLTCYSYSFMILAAPLTRVKKGIEAPLFGFAAPSQIVGIMFFWNDDKYTVLTLLSLLFCLGLICAFVPSGGFAWLFGRGSDEAAAAEGKSLITRSTKETEE